jgi:hypothetical protein
MEAEDLAESWLAIGAHEATNSMKSVYYLEQRVLKEKEEHVGAKGLLVLCNNGQSTLSEGDNCGTTKESSSACTH